MSDTVHFGIDELRGAASLFEGGPESFGQSFTAEQLILIYRAHRDSKFDYPPHHWTLRQIEQALLGISPNWDDDDEPIYKDIKLHIRIHR